MLFSALFIESLLPGSAHRRLILRLFGAKIGKQVIIKPRVRVKFPWKLSIGDDTWLGEAVWIDNLDAVKIGADCCISQGAYICTGSHDWSSSSFDLITKPISIGNCAWIGARASVAPGTVIAEGAMVTMGSVATGRLEAWSIYRGLPAQLTRKRKLFGELPL